jgi:hypothetical protein
MMVSIQNEVQCPMVCLVHVHSELQFMMYIQKALKQKSPGQPQTSEEDTECTVKVLTSGTFWDERVARYRNSLDIRTLHVHSDHMD